MTNTIYNTIEAITEYLNGLDDSDLVVIHNQYCQSLNYSDDEIYTNDEDFFNTFFESKVMDAVRAVAYGEYQYNNDYVIFNGYGNLESFDYVKDRIDIGAIAEDIKESPENYDIELDECFEIDGTWYEGSEEDGKEEYDEYVTETEEANEEAKEKETIQNFAAWAAENLNEIN